MTAVLLVLITVLLAVALLALRQAHRTIAGQRIQIRHWRGRAAKYGAELDATTATRPQQGPPLTFDQIVDLVHAIDNATSPADFLPGDETR